MWQIAKGVRGQLAEPCCLQGSWRDTKKLRCVALLDQFKSAPLLYLSHRLSPLLRLHVPVGIWQHVPLPCPGHVPIPIKIVRFLRRGPADFRRNSARAAGLSYRNSCNNRSVDDATEQISDGSVSLCIHDEPRLYQRKDALGRMLRLKKRVCKTAPGISQCNARGWVAYHRGHEREHTPLKLFTDATQVFLERIESH